ncbi:MAG: DNA mismatch repair protein MutS [Tissierellia bacterium]|nr:DNA mismatch repair protein MutS [Tissierellia bacterium]
MPLDIKALTPMMQQYFEIKATVPEHILFYRLGDFYEMFYEDAELASEALDLVLTARNAGGGAKAPLCGVPYHSAQNYIARLIDQGFTVAICEQVEDPKLAKNLVKREIVKIITQGTLVDEDFLKKSENNYLAALAREEGGYSLSYCDLSTFYLRSSYYGEEELSELEEELLSLKPSEILIEEGLELRTTGAIPRPKSTSKLLDSFLKVKPDEASLGSLSILFEYILETQFIEPTTSFDYEFLSREDFMRLDSTVYSHLELFETLIGKKKRGSLLGLLDRCSTAMGTRLLQKWIQKPLQSQNQINRRLDLVEFFYDRPEIIPGLEDKLGKIHDLERLISKLVYSHIMPKDLRKISASLEVVPEILRDIEGLDSPLISGLVALPELYGRLDETLLEDPAATIAEGGVISPKHHPELAELLYLLEHGTGLLLELEMREKEATGIKNLKIRYNRVFGYFLEVTNSNLHLVPDRYIRKQTLVGSERYFTEELKDLEVKILSAEEEQKVYERRVYEELVEEVKGYSEELLSLARALSVLDLGLSLARTARDQGYVRPVLVNDRIFELKNSRHPVLEALQGRENFISNDLYMDKDNHFFIITGPNMAGKSTYLRQVALITLMAHMGSFVPADSALIPLTDRIFTRVGASDDLSQGKSTFMVEMSELGFILNNASENSLVILDEIGRGTSTYDGLSIAWATTEYLNETIKPRCLFATHYHELTEAQDRIEGIKNFRIAVEQIGKDLIFLRKIVPGRAHRSYGIEAAKLAGLPESLINRASDILRDLEQKDIMMPSEDRGSEIKKLELAELRGLEMDEISPRDAWTILEDLKKNYG